ncbi:hypothetical protein [Thermospira aquatica]|uniref:Uncharacterized protein n=1 Tax=Thermospira aquatica TaxID=2828656 RepID=A0AAX3BCZ3_9SPIR|nr:hypothetical protein [Thermospira aquatica]URA10046.1 hypothetical protein KDW03_11270 [Thermospira aquatica]
MEFLSTFFYEAMIRISSTFLFDATGEKGFCMDTHKGKSKEFLGLQYVP